MHKFLASLVFDMTTLNAAFQNCRGVGLWAALSVLVWIAWQRVSGHMVTISCENVLSMS